MYTRIKQFILWSTTYRILKVIPAFFFVLIKKSEEKQGKGRIFCGKLATEFFIDNLPFSSGSNNPG